MSSHGELNTFRRSTGTKLGNLLTYRERLQSLKSHNPLILWSILSHVINCKIYISTDTALNLGRRFRTQKLKSSPTSCYIFLRFFPNYEQVLLYPTVIFLEKNLFYSNDLFLKCFLKFNFLLCKHLLISCNVYYSNSDLFLSFNFTLIKHLEK